MNEAETRAELIDPRLKACRGFGDGKSRRDDRIIERVNQPKTNPGGVK